MGELGRISVKCMETDSFGNSRLRCIFSSKIFEVETNSFVQIMTYPQDKSEISAGRETRYIGDIKLENLRAFIEELQGFVDTDDTQEYTKRNRASSESNPALGIDKYSFEGKGAEKYGEVETDENIINCPICGEIIYAKDEFLSLENFNSVIKKGLHQTDSESYFDCIHRKCLPEVIDELEKILKDTDTFLSGI